MSTPLTVESATVQLLLATHRLRDVARFDDESEDILAAWIDRFAGLFPIQRVSSSVTYLLNLQKYLEKPAGNIDSSISESLSEAVQIAIRVISERESLEQTLRNRTEQAIYDFAYGLTHEINNPLANIAARAQQLLVSSTESRDRKSLATIVDQSMRAHEMLAEMMRVVKPPRLERALVSVSDCIEAVASQFAAKLESAKIEFEIGPVPRNAFICVHRASVEEALGVLIQNSMEACGPLDKISISTTISESKSTELMEERRIQIEVMDTGTGLSVEGERRAFHLYYSGRENGRGLGISLANFKRSVEANGGLVAIKSSPQAGTAFQLEFPAISPPVAARRTFAK